MVKEINEATFNEEVLDSKGTTVAVFSAPWCGPCKMLAPLLDKLESCAVKKVNVDYSPQLSAEYSINAVPTILFFKNGNIETRLSGFHPVEKIQEIVNNINNEV